MVSTTVRFNTENAQIAAFKPGHASWMTVKRSGADVRVYMAGRPGEITRDETILAAVSSSPTVPSINDRKGPRLGLQSPGDRLLVDLADRGCRQRGHLRQYIRPRMPGHAALVEVEVQFRQRHRVARENNCRTNFFAQVRVRQRYRRY
jgi:hypothetical protein